MIYAMPNIQFETNQLQKLAKGITTHPIGFSVIILCIAVYFLFKDNVELRKELNEAKMEHIQTLKEINSQLKQLSDSTYKLHR